MAVQSLGMAAVTLGSAGLQLPISWISRWKRQMYPDKLMGESLGERNKRDDRSERADLRGILRVVILPGLAIPQGGRVVTRTLRHHKPTRFTGDSANISPSRRAGSNCASQASGQLGVGEQTGLSDSLEMGSHKDGSLWSSRSEVCAPLSTLSPSRVHPC